MFALDRERAYRRRCHRLAAALATAAAVLLAATGTASAAPQPAQLTDPTLNLGQELSLELSLESVTLVGIGQGPVGTASAGERSAKYMGLEGRLGFQIEPPDPQHPASTPMKVTEFTLTNAPDPAGTEQGVSPALIDIGLMADEVPNTMLNMLPPTGLEHVVPLNFEVTIENPPEGWAGAGVEQPGPLVLTTKNPAVLTGQLNYFPPRGETYQLQDPIELVDPDQPDQVVATIEKFPLQIGGS
jgi:hypothetical protein